MTEFEFVMSSYSGGKDGQECVAVARNVPGVIALRDSKVAGGAVIRVPSAAWAAFLQFTECAMAGTDVGQER